MDGGQAFKILPDGSWEEAQASFDQLKQEKHFFLWEKENQPFRALVVFPYDFSMRNLPVWFWISLFISVLTIINCPILFSRLKKDILDPLNTMNQALSAFQVDQSYRISVRELAAICYISADHLTRLFKKWFGVSVSEYIQEQRRRPNWTAAFFRKEKREEFA